jgi:Tfp pilus assembly protein PilO
MFSSYFIAVIISVWIVVFGYWMYIRNKEKTL